MVQGTRPRSRTSLTGKAPRLGRSRPTISGTRRANAMVPRPPKTDTLPRKWRIHRRREADEGVDALVWRRGMDEGYFRKQLQQVATVFPGSRLIQE